MFGQITTLALPSKLEAKGRRAELGTRSVSIRGVRSNRLTTRTAADLGDILLPQVALPEEFIVKQGGRLHFLGLPMRGSQT